MAQYAVRRLGQKPCTKANYANMVKREELVKAGDVEKLKAFDAALAKKNEKSGEEDKK